MPKGNGYKGRKIAARPGRQTKTGKGIGMGGFVKRLFLLLLTGVFVAVLSVGLLYGYRFMTSHPYFAIERIEVAGTGRLSRDEVVSLSGLRMGDNCLGVNIAEVVDRVVADPWIESATVTRLIPEGVRITVVERQPRFWRVVGGELHYADGEGDPIAPVTTESFATLPVLELAPGAERYPGVLAGLVREMDESGLPFGAAQIGWVRLGSRKGLEVFLEKENLLLGVDAGAWRRGFADIASSWADLDRRNELAGARVMRAMEGRVWVRLASKQDA
jgi:cell division protein FtsQ